MPLATAQVEAFILAGGASRRMGCEKSRLLVDGRPLVVRLAAALAPHVARLWLVAKRGADVEDLGIPVLYDDSPQRALVHGLLAVLRAPGAEWRFVLACDMPGVDGEILAAMWRTAQAHAAPGSVPRLPGNSAPEPLPSLWHRSLAAGAGTAWGLAARDWVRAARLAVWDVPAELAPRLVNLNTPEEWRAWSGRAPGGDAPCPAPPGG
jgi:molybdopterin-guanine dinucleotide biosynthesis protein A